MSSADSKKDSESDGISRKRGGKKKVNISVKKSQIIQENSDEDASMRSNSPPRRAALKGRISRRNALSVLQPKYPQSEGEEAGDAVTSEDDGDETDNISVLPKRKNKEDYDNEYDEACSKLQLNSIPDYFPCREREQDIITRYLREGISNK